MRGVVVESFHGCVVRIHSKGRSLPASIACGLVVVSTVPEVPPPLLVPPDVRAIYLIHLLRSCIQMEPDTAPDPRLTKMPPGMSRPCGPYHSDVDWPASS